MFALFILYKVPIVYSVKGDQNFNITHKSFVNELRNVLFGILIEQPKGVTYNLKKTLGDMKSFTQVKSIAYVDRSQSLD